MKFEIINPSDECYIEGTYEECCVATCILGDGKYGLKQVDGDLEMPLLLFGTGDEFFRKTFHKTFEESLKAVGENLSKVFSTVHTKTKSSMNDIEGYAKELSEKLKKEAVSKK